MDEGDFEVHPLFLVATSADDQFKPCDGCFFYNKETVDITLKIMDNDFVGVVLSTLEVNGTEGETVNFAVKLNSHPIAPVTVFLNHSDIQGVYRDLVFLPAMALYFNETNWE